jgi:flagellar assembly protein FliH
LSKIIKSFHSSNDSEEQDKVIGIQPVTNFINTDVIVDEDDEAKIARLKAEATRFLADAQSEASRIMAEAEQQYQAQNERLAKEEQEWRLNLDREEEIAKQKGYENGYLEGQTRGLESWQAELDELKRFLEKTKEDYYQVLHEAEPQMIVLAIKAAEKILGSELQENPESWSSLIKQLVKEVRESEEIKLYVPLQWYELTLSYREELVNLLQSNATLFIYPDETLQENGAIIEFPFGKIDASLDVQLKEIREKLLEQIEVTGH